MSFFLKSVSYLKSRLFCLPAIKIQELIINGLLQIKILNHEAAV